jgi:hypothetical protein
MFLEYYKKHILFSPVLTSLDRGDGPAKSIDSQPGRLSIFCSLYSFPGRDGAPPVTVQRLSLAVISRHNDIIYFSLCLINIERNIIQEYLIRFLCQPMGILVYHLATGEEAVCDGGERNSSLSLPVAW